MKNALLICIVAIVMAGCETTDMLSRVADVGSEISFYRGRNVGETRTTIENVEGDVHLHLTGENMQEHEGGGSVTATATPQE